MTVFRDNAFLTAGPASERGRWVREAFLVDSDWLPEDEVRRMLASARAGKPRKLRSFLAVSPLRATDERFSCLVLVRDHDAWFKKVWQDANSPVAAGGDGLQMINYYDKTLWGKLPVPKTARIRSVQWDGMHFVFETDRGPVRSTPKQVKLAVMDSMTGRGLSDKKIEHNFGKLDGSVPLEWL
jgi:hypothetical protein